MIISRRKLLKDTGAAAALLSTTTLPAVACAGGPHPDAELIALCNEFAAVQEQYDNSGIADDNHPVKVALWARYEYTSDRIPLLHAHTLEAVAAKLRFAYLCESWLPEERDGPAEGTPHPHKLMWDVMRDVERMVRPISDPQPTS